MGGADGAASGGDDRCECGGFRVKERKGSRRQAAAAAAAAIARFGSCCSRVISGWPTCPFAAAVSPIVFKNKKQFFFLSQQKLKNLLKSARSMPPSPPPLPPPPLPS